VKQDPANEACEAESEEEQINLEGLSPEKRQLIEIEQYMKKM